MTTKKPDDVSSGIGSLFDLAMGACDAVESALGVEKGEESEEVAMVVNFPAVVRDAVGAWHLDPDQYKCKSFRPPMKDREVGSVPDAKCSRFPVASTKEIILVVPLCPVCLTTLLVVAAEPK